MRNQNKCLILDDSEMDKLPEELLKRSPQEDKYLVHTAYNTETKLIVTTDRKLQMALEGSIITVKLVDQFIEKYIKEHPMHK